jgi:hypothetical protein
VIRLIKAWKAGKNARARYQARLSIRPSQDG